MTEADHTPLIAAVRRALRRAALPGDAGPLEALSDTGLAHLHLRLVGTGWLVRVPKQSQMGLAADAHLAYEAACFERAAPAGHSPCLAAVLPPTSDLPHGALVVDDVQGRALKLQAPTELGALVAALAAIHAQPLPGGTQRAPLLDPADPLLALVAEIEQQAVHLDAAGLAPAARASIDRERRRLEALLATPGRPPRHLIAFDAHPGNFLLDVQGRAWLVDLEKARYGAAALDLAHATLYTSTTWDLASQTVLDDAQVLRASQAWLDGLAGHGLDVGLERSWIAPLRRAMWLWSVTWCAQWRVQSVLSRRGADGQDWSTELSDAALVAHVQNRVDHYLETSVIDMICAQADRLAEALRG
jgi:hypothetical protein